MQMNMMNSVGGCSFDVNGIGSSGMIQGKAQQMNMNNGINVGSGALSTQNAQTQMQMFQMQLQQQQNRPIGMINQSMAAMNVGGMMSGNPMGVGTMGSFSTIRTNIPNLDDVCASSSQFSGGGGGGSGFSFLNGAGGGNVKPGDGDSFSFVNDAMKASKK